MADLVAPALAVIRFGVAAILGFVLPGYFAARILRGPDRWSASFLASLVVLFHGVFWTHALGVPIRFATVFGVLAVATGSAAAAAWRWGSSSRGAGRQPLMRWDYVLLGPVVVIGGLMLLRATLAPLSGFDTYFRWDFLARTLLETGHLRFYPPVTAEDFKTYFYVDGIPPLVSLSYWWLYASLGRHVPAVTSLLVVAQFSLIALLTYRIGSRLVSRRAGILAASVLVSSPLFFQAVAMGQETGLTALSLAGTIYFLVAAEGRKDVRAVVLAGLSAAVGTLSREYGWAFLIVGLLLSLWLRHSPRALLVFGLTVTVAAAPWYLRNWIVTGNPLYSHQIGGLFFINPVHAAILDNYNAHLGVKTYTASHWASVLLLLLKAAPLQVVLGPIGMIMAPRRWAPFALVTALMGMLWLASIGWTAGGVEYSARVLSPALVLLSITAAVFLDGIARGPAVRMVAAGVVLVAALWTALFASLFPLTPDMVPVRQWPQVALQPRSPEPAEVLLRQVPATVLPPGSRVLTDNAYAHAALANAGVEAVPVWSPEVSFLFDGGADATAARKGLLDRGIRFVLYYPRSLNAAYLARFPFYRRDAASWIPLVWPRDRTWILYRLPGP